MPEWSLCSFCDPVKGSYATELFLRDELLRVVAVEDLHRRNFQMRVLLIPFEHIHEKDAGVDVKHRLKRVVDYLSESLRTTRGLATVSVDWDRHSFNDHYHIQMCMGSMI